MIEQRRVQGQDVDFELQSLGWKAFQQLCATVAGDTLGQAVEVFLPSRDAGRDGAFRGVWKSDGSAEFEGPFTVQCKFTSKRDATIATSVLDEDFEKARRLGLKGLARSYLLMTNYGVSGPAAEQIRARILAMPGIKHCGIFGREWLNSKIRESARLRMLVPRIYGLGDLSQILDERAYAQAREILSVMGEDLSKFVITDAHRRSAKALIEHGFVLLLGEPASGKSTIAASLALGAVDLWQCSTLKIRNAAEFLQHWNPNESRQFFWVDDAFGPTQYQRTAVDNWNGILLEMSAAIRKGARVLFTSRDYIYRAALQDLKISGFPLFGKSQVIIKVNELTLIERQQILYNHIKRGTQPRQFKMCIKPYLTSIAANSNFLPETARRIGDRLFTKKMEITQEGIKSFVEEPVDFLADVLQSIDKASHAAMALLFMNGGSLRSPVRLGRSETSTIEVMGARRSDVLTALRAMDGSLTKLIQSKGEMIWTYKHPTVADAFATIIGHDPELLDIYLTGTKPEKMVEEIICSGMALSGASVVVPANRYEVLIKRLANLAYKPLLTFLASRCDEAFLSLYVTKHPGILDDISSVSSQLLFSPEIPTAAKLQEYGLLPREHKRRLVNSIAEAAVLYPDADFMKPDVMRGLLSEEETGQILNRVRKELIPTLDDLVIETRSNYPRDVSPGDYFSSAISTLQVFQDAFKDEEVRMALSRAMQRLVDSISDFEERHNQQEFEDPEYRHISSSPNEDRSIFEDVDE